MSSWEGVHEFSGCLSEPPVSSGSGQRVRLTVLLDAVQKMPVQIRIPDGRGVNSLEKGDCLTGTARWKPYPGQWEREHLFGSAFRPVLYEASLKPWDTLSVDTSGRKSRLDREARDREALLRQRVQNVYPPDVAGLLGAMVLSDTGLLPPDLLQSFQRSGVYHLLSVSGEHMALLALFLTGGFTLFLRFVPASPLRRMVVRFPVTLFPGWLAVPVLLSYLFLIGAPLPAVRAGVAFVLVMLGRLAGGPRSWPDILGLSILVLGFLYPEAPLSLSVDLSLMALWGLSLSGRRREPNCPEVLGEERKAGGVREHLETGVIVMLTTLPLLWFSLGKADWVGIVSNMFAVPLAGDVFLPLGFLSMLALWVVPGGFPLLNELTSKAGDATVGLVEFFSRIPFGQIALPSLSPAALLFLTALVLSWDVAGDKGEPGKGERSLKAIFCTVAFFIVLSGTVFKSRDWTPVRALQGNGGTSSRIPRWEPQIEWKNLGWLFSTQGPDNRIVR